ncbi:hypothetical protein Aura_00072 [Pseudomonas phage vB_PpuM-Aura]
MSLSYRPGLTQALNLLDTYPADRDPLEVLTEYRQMLVKELDDNLPTLKEVQEWMTLALYKSKGVFHPEQFRIRALEELNMVLEYDLEKVTTDFKIALVNKRRRVWLTLSPMAVPPPDIKFQLYISAINVEE